MRVSSLSEQKWATAKASCSDNSYGETFQDANEEQKRDAARCFLVLHCSHLLAQTAVAAAPALESPAPEAAVAATAVAEPEAAAAAAANAAVADVADGGPQSRPQTRTSYLLGESIRQWIIMSRRLNLSRCNYLIAEPQSR